MQAYRSGITKVSHLMTRLKFCHLRHFSPLDLLATVSTLQQISSNNALRSCPQMASRVTHTLMNLLNAIEPGEQHEKLTRVVSQTMCDLIQQLGSRFLTFETRVRSQFRKAGISTERLDTLINSLRSNPQSLLNSSHGDKINGCGYACTAQCI
jgi:hypothetical protein